ncbi:probable S-adenosylmethionine-dependent methyltransferase At5g38780 [Pecten maximus]|uniref:probable S-adenosylmethionine-dependent methyltransferase At5g38780 n=1 Tax=Pecten maximus TaxID=6579 RepID=UPI0014582E1A|nr:probable S-adenosylmethionine-dependent methyltransferase At5g38780 [Pecten maximus]
MARYFPTMKIKNISNGEVDDMYNVHGHALNLCRTPILTCLRRIIDLKSTYKEGDPVQIADFGTADGRASLTLFNEMIDIIQADLGKDQPIVVYHNDQPRNDFNILSSVIQGDENSSGLAISRNVYPVMLARTMYEQCLPNDTLDLSISSIAGHYLSKHVCQIKNGVFMGEADESEQTLMREQGKSDWRDFVMSRGRELKPGGFLITINVTSDEENNVVSQLDKGMHHLGSFVTDMTRERVITQAEYLAINFNGHYLRKPADFKEPFTSEVLKYESLDWNWCL